ncbi:MAG: hypothetical protein H7A41_01625 [Chlamydiales bacterium]|nr:hypothetical protein [Chlamydiales bacterium]
MALPSQVSGFRGAHHYFTDMQNLLLAAGTVCFLGKHLVSYLGRNCADFPCLEKISSTTAEYFVFYDFASAAKSAYSLGVILKDGADVLRKAATHQQVRERRKGDMPREDTPYNLGRVDAWMAYKGASAVFKGVSSAILVHEAFKRLGVVSDSFSSTVRTTGSLLGAAGFAIEIIDTGRAFYNHRQDEADGRFPTDEKIASADRKGQPRRLNGGDEVLHRGLIQENRKYDMAFMTLVVAIKLMGAVRALDMVESTGLLGRISQFAADNAENIYGTLFTAMTVTGLVQHALYGATIQQLEQRNVNKA